VTQEEKNCDDTIEEEKCGKLSILFSFHVKSGVPLSHLPISFFNSPVEKNFQQQTATPHFERKKRSFMIVDLYSRRRSTMKPITRHPTFFILTFTISLLLLIQSVGAGGWVPVSSVSSPFNAHVLLNYSISGDCAIPFGTTPLTNLFYTPAALGVSTTVATTRNSLQGIPYYFPVNLSFSHCIFHLLGLSNQAFLTFNPYRPQEITP